MTTQSIPVACPRCGSDLRPLTVLAASSARLASAATESRSGLERMRLVVPDTVKASLRTLEEGLPVLARSLECHAGTCTRGAAR